ncbi:patatin-like phospholipase family protein [Oceanirhabdus sp. W0125-5]|uniref:patatin-like phospholipase family protein n=1 Tax=Oceanirhabdus sp. W0125-5 TaxID=2999116 RepID=UPI0022F2EDCA|nr:patatin family protein [Oceanirhabdus sp. W0125-5]WBW96459.1 patatin family protein [Oceanirhabdus sp. W0125-5]
MNGKIGLVIEGGGLRGLYASGVLDYFIDENIYFPYVIGVSMGACNGASYIAKQRGRTKKVTLDYLNDKRYLSYRRLLTSGNLFGMDFIFDEIPNKLLPFDYETYKKSEQEFVIVTTDCETGKPVYYNKEHCDDINKILKASCSLPFVSNIIEHEGRKLLDGGVTDSIPVRKALEDGNEKLVIILTRDEGYVKKPLKGRRLAEKIYKKYPKLVKAILNRHITYNETINYIKELESQGKAFVIRPSESLNIGRAERNKEKLEKYYELGYKQGEMLGDKLKAFINE